VLWFIALVCGVGGAIVRRGPPALRPWRNGLVAIAAFWVVVALFNPLQQGFSELLLWTWAGIAGAGAGLAGRRAA
jgi:hypothetical protein